MKQLSTRQGCVMLFIVTCAMKLLALPSLLIKTSGNAAWLAVIMMFLIDGSLLLIVFGLMKSFPNLSFKQFLKQCLGSVVTKIILFILGLLFALKVAMLARECYEFFTETAYVDFSWLVYLVPLGMVLGYLSTKEIRALARGGEIFLYFIVFAISVSFLFSIASFDAFSVLPFLPKGFSPVTTSLLDYCFWFGDFLIVFFYMGDVKYEKNSFKKMFVAYASAMAVVLGLTLIHYSLFGSVSINYKTSIVDVTEYIPRITAPGRFTWVIIFLWPIALLFSMVVYQNLSVKCFQDCFNIEKKDKKYISYCAVALSLSFLIITAFSQNIFIQIITSYVKYAVFVIQVILPLFLPVLMLINFKRENVSHEKSLEK